MIELLFGVYCQNACSFCFYDDVISYAFCDVSYDGGDLKTLLQIFEWRGPVDCAHLHFLTRIALLVPIRKLRTLDRTAHFLIQNRSQLWPWRLSWTFSARLSEMGQLWS